MVIHKRAALRSVTVSVAMMLVLSFALSAFAANKKRPRRRGRTYTIQILSVPAGAQLYIDGVEYGAVGTTPYKGRWVVGTHQLVAKKEGYHDALKEIVVSRKARTFTLGLKKKVAPAFVQISVSSDPNLRGAGVVIDGKSVGVAPVKHQVSLGRHLVEISKPGFDRFTTWVELKEGQTMALAPSLKKTTAAPGALLVAANAPGARATVDGRPVAGALPVVVEKLAPGAHVVEVTAPDAAPWRQVVQVVSGQRLKVTATLKLAPKVGSLLLSADVPNATFTVDGTPRKEPGPMVIEGLSIGSHAVVATAEGESWTGAVDIAANQRAKLVVPLAALIAKTKAAKAQAVSAQAAQTAQLQQSAAESKKAAVAAALRAERERQAALTGTLVVTANVTGVEVMVDGKSSGMAPLTLNGVAPGLHNVVGRKGERVSSAVSVPVVGGKSQSVALVLDMAPTAKERAAEREAQALRERREWERLDAQLKTPFGARVLPERFASVSVGSGFPHYLQGEVAVGVVNTEQLAFDAAFWVRSTFSLSEAGGKFRFKLGQGHTFAAAAVGYIGGGTGVGPRNSFVFGAGVVGTAVIRERVAVSGHITVDVWSERLCPADDATQEEVADAADVCRRALPAADQSAAEGMLDGKLNDRDFGARLGLGLNVEVRIQPWLNVFLGADIAPGQTERAGYSGFFHTPLLFDRDPGVTGHAGVSLLF